MDPAALRVLSTFRGTIVSGEAADVARRIRGRAPEDIPETNAARLERLRDRRHALSVSCSGPVTFREHDRAAFVSCAGLSVRIETGEDLPRAPALMVTGPAIVELARDPVSGAPRRRLVVFAWRAVALYDLSPAPIEARVSAAVQRAEPEAGRVWLSIERYELPVLNVPEAEARLARGHMWEFATASGVLNLSFGRLVLNCDLFAAPRIAPRTARLPRDDFRVR